MTKMVDRWWLGGFAMLIAVAGSVGAWPAAAADPSAAPMGSAAPIAASLSPSAADGSPADTVQLGNLVIGTGTYPGYTLEVPDGWSSMRKFTVRAVGEPLGISIWDVGQMPSDPCHWQDSTYLPGPTVDDLVQALEGQASREATAPVDVTLAGHQGRYLEWSVPADLVVTGDSDFQGCDVQPSNGHLDFVSWWGNGEGERYQQLAGQVDRLWVLDVGGQRLVVDATHPPDTTPAVLAEQDRIVQSLRFDGS